MSTYQQHRRACDCCRVRKLKCDGNGESVCSSCRRSSLVCTYAQANKPGPRGLRTATLRAIAQSRSPNDIAICTSSIVNRVKLEDLRPVIDIYREKLKVVWPVVDLALIYDRLSDPYPPKEFYALVVAMALATISQLHLPEIYPLTARFLISEVMRVKSSIPGATLESILTSYFLHTYFSNERNNTSAFMCLREAIAGLQSLGLHREETYANLPPAHEKRLRNFYYMMMITERGYSLLYEMPVILEPSIRLPSVDGVEDEEERLFMTGFLCLLQIFLAPDRNMIDTWKRPEYACLNHTQRTVTEIMKVDPLMLTNEAQKVDIFVTQRWMQILTWQLAVLAGDSHISVTLPEEVVRSIMAIGASVSVEAFEVHGPELKFKLYEISSVLADVVLCLPKDCCNDSWLHISADLLHYFIQFVASLRSTEPRKRDGILGKLIRAMELYNIPTNLMTLESYDNDKDYHRVSELLDG
ncbi:hypothetical protein V1509DRAFT_562218 [Lipomyces kononenkoae]